MRWFDTHCHLQDARFQEDLEAVLQRAREAGVEELLIVGSALADSRQAVDLALEHGLYASVGVHPHDAKDWTPDTAGQLEALIQESNDQARAQGRDPVVVAIGEIGLDYHYDFSPRERQKEVFAAQLRLASRLALPVVLHEREAFQDSYGQLQKAHEEGLLLAEAPGVAHCFSGSVESARLLVKLGFYLGFDGPLTFHNVRRAPEVVADTPLDRLLIETDAPYLTPTPHRGKRNEPAYLPLIGMKMAEILNLPVEEIARQTRENGRRLFRLTN